MHSYIFKYSFSKVGIDRLLPGRNMSERPIYLFAHIPKTGGQTVRNHFIRIMKPQGRMISANARTTDFADHIQSFSAAQREAHDLVVGRRVNHDIRQYFPSRSPRFFTVLREPTSHVISVYNYNWRHRKLEHGKDSEPESFDRWFKPKNYNRMSLWLITSFLGRPIAEYCEYSEDEVLNEARAVLKSCWLVARLEDLERTLKPAFDALGVPRNITDIRNIAGRDYSKRLVCTPEIEAHIRECSKADMQLYEEFNRPPET